MIFFFFLKLYEYIFILLTIIFHNSMCFLKRFIWNDMSSIMFLQFFCNKNRKKIFFFTHIFRYIVCIVLFNDWTFKYYDTTNGITRKVGRATEIRCRKDRSPFLQSHRKWKRTYMSLKNLFKPFCTVIQLCNCHIRKNENFSWLKINFLSSKKIIN